MTKLIYDPMVYLVGVQELNREEMDRFLGDHDVEWSTDTEEPAEELCEVAGRICYMSFNKPRPGGNKIYLEHILEVGHGSVTEHAVWNFIFTGVSRSLSHELVRHRAGWGYSQLSQRYVQSSGVNFVVPHYLQEEVRAADKFLSEMSAIPGYQEKLYKNCKDPFDFVRATIHAMENLMMKPQEEPIMTGLMILSDFYGACRSYQEYEEKMTSKYTQWKYEEYINACRAIDMTICPSLGPSPVDSLEEWSKNLPQNDKTEIRKAARSTARWVLPNAAETKIFATANARAIRHFIEMRCSKPAEVEIRKLAHQIARIMKDQAPNLFGDYQFTKLPDGTYAADTKWRKV